jgi:hypothetical protein
VSPPPGLAEALQVDYRMTLRELAETEMDWFYEWKAIADAFRSGQQSAKESVEQQRQGASGRG